MGGSELQFSTELNFVLLQKPRATLFLLARFSSHSQVRPLRSGGVETSGIRE